MQKYLGLLAIIAVVLNLGGCNIKRKAVKTYAQYATQAPFDVVIVPGITYDTARPFGLFNSRLYWAKELYDKGITKNIIFSGAAVRTCYVEGKVMKIYADSLGIPPGCTFSEVHAEHSVQNIYLGYRMAHKLGFKKIALATDAFQASNLGSFIKRYTPDMAILPCTNDSLAQKPLPKIDPTGSYMCSFKSLDEREGFFKRLHGTFNIDTAALNKFD